MQLYSAGDSAISLASSYVIYDRRQETFSIKGEILNILFMWSLLQMLEFAIILKSVRKQLWTIYKQVSVVMHR